MMNFFCEELNLLGVIAHNFPLHDLGDGQFRINPTFLWPGVTNLPFGSVLVTQIPQRKRKKNAIIYKHLTISKPLTSNFCNFTSRLNHMFFFSKRKNWKKNNNFLGTTFLTLKV